MQRTTCHRGYSLLELLISMAVFTIILLVAYTVFQRSNEGYVRGQNQAEMIQAARVAFDQMTDDIRMAGFEFDIDGATTKYPNQADEPIEYMHDRAISVRANFDYETGVFRGREPGLECSDCVDTCCPVVTTGNDEIITYALGKNPGDPNPPVGQITLRLDLSGTAAVDGNSAGQIRDATVNSAGTPQNEETLTITGVELLNLNNPPYVLYRFVINDNGSVDRQPLVDNVRDLTFSYYDSAGARIFPPAGNPEAGADTRRAERFDVRRVRVDLQTMEPQQDLRWADATDTNPLSRRHRKYPLQEDVFPPNLGRRGQIDRAVIAPGPVKNVTICTGECGMVRVSWTPPPPEDRVRDYIVDLHSGPPATAARLGTFVKEPSFDGTVTPNQEYVVLTQEDDSDLVNGTLVFARVFARNEAGAESDPADSPTGMTIVSRTRPDALNLATGSGYDAASSNWPDARNNNSGGLQITTNSNSPAFPQAGSITLILSPPKFVLNKGGGAPVPPNYDWSTKAIPNGSGGVAEALACHRRESTPSDATDGYDRNADTVKDAWRTPFENYAQSAGPMGKQRSIYVFRVSGSDDWNWDGEPDANNAVAGGSPINNPRNFVPGVANLYDVIFREFTSSTVNYADASDYNFYSPAGATNPDESWLSGYRSGPPPTYAGMPFQTPHALTPGEVFYYKFRVVSQCWSDGEPDGYHDTWPFDAVQPLSAWSLRQDFGSDTIFRQPPVTPPNTDWTLSISPFYPPLRPDGNSGTARVRPLQSVHDSDDVNRASGIDAYAVPAYALPLKDATGNWAPPAKPTEFYLAKTTESGSGLLPNNGMRAVFNSSKRSAPADGSTPQPAAYMWYEIHRVAATSSNPSASEMNFTPTNSTRLNGAQQPFRLKGGRAYLAYTIDRQDEGAPFPGSHTFMNGLRTSSPGPNLPWIYRLVAVQATEFDDGIDTSSVNRSAASRPFLYPCGFYDEVRQMAVTATGVAPSQVVNVQVVMADVTDTNCVNVKSARLLAFNQTSGDNVGTSGWLDLPADTCTFQFPPAMVTDAENDYVANVRFAVELSNQPNPSVTWDGTPVGCRVRSDLLGEGQDLGTLSIGCAVDCGDNSTTGAKIFGPVDNTHVTVTGERTLEIRLENRCMTTDFSIQQLEFDLISTTGTAIPPFVAGDIVAGVRNAPVNLPQFPEVNAPYAGTGTRRLRWFTSFNGDYPVVEADATDVIVRLTFGGRLCDVKVDKFNFRVPYTAGGLQRQLLCTRRTDDPNNPVTQSPPGQTGSGRGPTTNTVLTCGSGATCVQACPTGTCPVNNNMQFNDDVQLLPDANGPGRLVRVNYVETCLGDPDCSVEMTKITVQIRPSPGRACTGPGTALPVLSEARITFDDMTPDIVLPAPTLSQDGPTSPCQITYQWLNLAGVHVPEGSAFNLDLHFSGSMTLTEFTDLGLGFGDPLPVPSSYPVPCNVPSARLPVPIRP